MQKYFEIEQGVSEIWGFKGLEMILLRETKKRGKYHCAGVGQPLVAFQTYAIVAPCAATIIRLPIIMC